MTKYREITEAWITAHAHIYEFFGGVAIWFALPL